MVPSAVCGRVVAMDVKDNVGLDYSPPHTTIVRLDGRIKGPENRPDRSEIRSRV